MSTSAVAPGEARAFADELERYRIARRLTPAELARAVGARTSQVSRWRRGYGISMEQLERVAVWMGRSLAELMPLAGYPAPLPAPASSAPTDPRFESVRAAWPRMSEERKNIIRALALEVCKRTFGSLLSGAMYGPNWLRPSGEMRMDAPAGQVGLSFGH